MDILRSVTLESANQNPKDQSSELGNKQNIKVDGQFDVWSMDAALPPSPNDAPPEYQNLRPKRGSVTNALKVLESLGFHTSFQAPSISSDFSPVRTSCDYKKQYKTVRESLGLPKSAYTQHDSAAEQRIEAATHQSPLENTAVLCETKGASVTFTQPDDAMPGSMGVVTATSSCTIRIVSRRKEQPGSEPQTLRSIWISGDDGKTCIQHKLPCEGQVIPYTLWPNTTKVIIRRPSSLRFFPPSTPLEPTVQPLKKRKTNWTTYVFSDEQSSSLFQSTLMAPLQLLLSLPTTRTVRLHPSALKRTFSSKLQLCGLENLRLWHDSTDPTALVCMIHYAPSFRPARREEGEDSVAGALPGAEEYLVFRLYAPPKNTVRIREDGEKGVKIKGLDIRVENEEGGWKAAQKRKGKERGKAELMEEEAYGRGNIEKVKVEFESGAEKKRFLEMTREVQGFSSW
ncbi:MAG: hypothetical protein Q9167_000477 [Letrouitia subvulpina]